MTRSLLRSVVLLSALALGGCNVDPQPLPPDKQQYAGTWAGQGMKLVIEPGGRVEYERDNTTINGPIQKYEGDDFTVGAFGLTTTFDVQEPPHEAEDGTWRMKVDGVELMRIDADMILKEIVGSSKE